MFGDKNSSCFDKFTKIEDSLFITETFADKKVWW